MHALEILSIFIGVGHAYNMQLLPRRTALMSGTSVVLLKPKPEWFAQRVLLVGCGTLGQAIAGELRKQVNNVHLTAATTKPKRVLELMETFDDVVVIPQLASVSDRDEVLRNAVRGSNAVIMADVIKIFSAHSIAATASRIRTLVDGAKDWNGVLGMVSSENVYGCVLGGDKLYEHSPIYPNIGHVSEEGPLQWYINPLALAKTLRHAENEIVGGPQVGFVLRTAGLWDDNKFLNAALYTGGKSFPMELKNSFMSFSTVNTVAKAVSWALQRRKQGIYNVCEKNIMGMTRGLFYDKIHEMYGSRERGGVIWDPSLPFDKDRLYCMDPDPFKACSQRCNSQLMASKIAGEGFL